MSWERWVVAFVIILVGAAQYGLAIHALRDLRRRPRVRGDNKVAWALLILVVPIFGPLYYAMAGPTSFMPRSGAAALRGTRPPRRPPRWMASDGDDDGG